MRRSAAKATASPRSRSGVHKGASLIVAVSIRELAGKDAERWHAYDGQHPEHQSPADQRIALEKTLNLIHLLRPMHLRGMSNREKYRGFRQTMNEHMQQSAEGSQGTTNPNAKVAIPCVL